MNSVRPLALAFYIWLLLLGAAHAESPFTVGSPEERKSWLIAEREGLGSPEILTTLEFLPDKEIRAKYPHLLSIAWGYESLQNGLPTESEILKGRNLYSSFDKILGSDGIWAMTLTGDGGRTMHYYVRDFENHAPGLRAYLDSLPPISIKVSLRNDVDWEFLRKAICSIRKTK